MPRPTLPPIPSPRETAKALHDIAREGQQPKAVIGKSGIDPIWFFARIGGPGVPTTAADARERLVALREVLAELVERFDGLTDDDCDLEELSTLKKPRDFEDEEPPRQPFREAAELVFQLKRPESIPPDKDLNVLYKEAGELEGWMEIKNPRWFEKSHRAEFVYRKLAEWLIEREQLHREVPTRPSDGEPWVPSTNPLPKGGTPHGRGIRHFDYPNGYQLEGEARPSFNNYLDLPDGTAIDERSFTGARVLRPDARPAEGFEAMRALIVRPGDLVAISIYIHNNAGLAGNQGGDGPGVARNSRVYVNFPTEESATLLSIGCFIRADNAVVDEAYPELRTVSDNTVLASADESPIRLRYLTGKARFLQRRTIRAALSPPAAEPDEELYRSWTLPEAQEYWLFTGQIRNVRENAEQSAELGLPIGSDGSRDPLQAAGRSQGDQLLYFGGNSYVGILQFQVAVEAGSSKG